MRGPSQIGGVIRAASLNGYKWTEADVSERLRIIDFAVSDSNTTVKRADKSWIIRNPVITTNQPSINASRGLANLLNGKTPTGTEWDINY